MNAILLVDIQNDFLPGGALAVPDGDLIIPLVNRLMKHFEVVVATQDWHPVGHGSFASAHPGAHVGDVVMLNDLEQILWPDHCVQHTRGADLSARLEAPLIRGFFTKGTDPGVDSYSAFFDNGRRRANALDEYLVARDVDTVYLAGLATDYCVRFTALDAVALGFRAVLVKDACRGVNLKPGDADQAIADMQQAGVEVTTSDVLLAEER